MIQTQTVEEIFFECFNIDKNTQITDTMLLQIICTTSPFLVERANNIEELRRNILKMLIENKEFFNARIKDIIG